MAGEVWEGAVFRALSIVNLPLISSIKVIGMDFGGYDSVNVSLLSSSKLFCFL